METLQDILGYELFSVKEYSVTVYKLAIVLFILLMAKVVAMLFSNFIRRSFIKKRIDKSRQIAVIKLVSYFIYIIAIVLVLENIGVNITILLAGSAAFLVGLGFGVQQIFGDFVSGLIILFEGTLGVGDIVELNDGTVGKVQEIGMRTSLITTRDNIDILVPNSSFIQDKVVNWSHNRNQTRFKVEVGVAYGSDVELVRSCLMEVAEAHAQVLKEPPPYIRFNDFGDSALIFEILFWTHDDFQHQRIRSDLRFAIDKIFRENKITIPFPQRDLHVKSSEVRFTEKG